ncbi:hypothetical protein P0R31_37060 [Bradyrhizobium yuanmingense]|uniref:hypothetical protein n=1 Tax=Bradyrhizobium yuanmingense TaxID=108015 RepID=UPI0023B8D795|nr:hypothetical protein [Bradyrhizobium yuanmingense]MDF0522849.1 hypothetical protein [Bradyrhizobium yuanmingense]
MAEEIMASCPEERHVLEDRPAELLSELDQRKYFKTVDEQVLAIVNMQTAFLYSMALVRRHSK